MTTPEEPGTPPAPPASDPVPDTAMATGDDDGEPGERLADPPLDAPDRELLAALRSPGEPVVDPVETTPAAAAAAQDDSVLLPPPAGEESDPLTPQFRSAQE